MTIKNKIIFEIDERNNIAKAQKIEVATDIEKDLEIGEALRYVYEDCHGMEDMLIYEEKELEEANKIMASKQFEFEKFKFEVFNEAFEQLRFDPIVNIKSIFVLPILRILVVINEIQKSNKLLDWFRKTIILPIKDTLIRFLFGKENAKEIDKLIEEGRKKFLEEV